MKKLFIIPVFLVCITGASPNKVQSPSRNAPIDKLPISSKVDSLNVKVTELNQLIRQR